MYCAREKENIMTIIVTGGAGFIGSNFIFHMLKKYPDYRIICLDCLTYAGNLSTLAPVMDNKNFRFVKEISFFASNAVSFFRIPKAFFSADWLTTAPFLCFNNIAAKFKGVRLWRKISDYLISSSIF